MTYTHVLGLSMHACMTYTQVKGSTSPIWYGLLWAEILIKGKPSITKYFSTFGGFHNIPNYINIFFFFVWKYDLKRTLVVKQGPDPEIWAAESLTVTRHQTVQIKRRNRRATMNTGQHVFSSIHQGISFSDYTSLSLSLSLYFFEIPTISSTFSLSRTFTSLPLPLSL